MNVNSPPREIALAQDGWTPGIGSLRCDRGLVLTDCLQVQLFELPKDVPPSDNRVINDPIEQWL